jgi:CheY-like chemotaxis protein/HPt (histidine-containing phosphotransfer) domain-containing protein
LLFLVVDDDELSRELFQVLLAEEDDQVEVAETGREALARLEMLDPQPQAILTDLQMPGLSGGKLALELRAAAPAGTLVFAMSGSTPPASALADFDGFLLKPFTISDLRSMITGTRSLRTAPNPNSVDFPGAEHRANQSVPNPEPSAAVQSEPAQTANAGTSALDEEIYRKLSELMPGEPLAQMYALCLEDARVRIGLMRELAAGGDDDGYRREAHAVKGGSGMIGASELYQYATAAESGGLKAGVRGHGTSGVIATLDALSLACDRLERILVERRRV